jgi:pyruvate kinase
VLNGESYSMNTKSRRAKIVCTIGPASDSEEMICNLNALRNGCCAAEFFAWNS